MQTDTVFSFLAQVETGQHFSDGLFEAAHAVCLIDNELGLGAIAVGPAETSGAPLKALQILQDDMRTNLAETPVAEGLRESMTNIHEYLQNTNGFADNEGIGLVAVHASDQGLHVISSGGFGCWHVHDGKASDLCADSAHVRQLGCQQELTVQQAEHKPSVGDLVLLIGSSDWQRVGAEFMQLTLGRFSDNPEVALRQINTRLAHRAGRQTPPMLFARCESTAARKKGWLSGLLSN